MTSKTSAVQSLPFPNCSITFVYITGLLDKGTAQYKAFNYTNVIHTEKKNMPQLGFEATVPVL
jgi:hypothetical protein